MPKEIKVEMQLPKIQKQFIDKKRQNNFVAEKKAVEKELAKKENNLAPPKIETKPQPIPKKQEPVIQKKGVKEKNDIMHMEKTVISDVNLIPSSATWERKFSTQTKIFYLSITILVSLIITSVIYSGITWYEIKINKQVKESQTVISDLEKHISFYEENFSQMKEVQKQLSLVAGLLNQHLYWTKLLDKLEAHTIDEVYYLDFSATNNNDLSLSAIGKDYSSVARQLVAFKEADFVEEVSITSASMSVDPETLESTALFSIGLILKEDILIKK